MWLLYENVFLLLFIPCQSSRLFSLINIHSLIYLFFFPGYSFENFYKFCNILKQILSKIKIIRNNHFQIQAFKSNSSEDNWHDARPIHYQPITSRVRYLSKIKKISMKEQALSKWWKQIKKQIYVTTIRKYFSAVIYPVSKPSNYFL